MGNYELQLHFQCISNSWTISVVHMNISVICLKAKYMGSWLLLDLLMLDMLEDYSNYKNVWKNYNPGLCRSRC